MCCFSTLTHTQTHTRTHTLIQFIFFMFTTVSYAHTYTHPALSADDTRTSTNASPSLCRMNEISLLWKCQCHACLFIANSKHTYMQAHGCLCTIFVLFSLFWVQQFSLFFIFSSRFQSILCEIFGSLTVRNEKFEKKKRV